jgi:hypothetical protein
VRQKPHSRSFFDFIIREVHKVTKVRRFTNYKGQER